MKSTFFVMCISSIFQVSALAELDFPELAKLSPIAQQAWGYSVNITERPNPNLTVTLSPTAAKTYQGARLFLRDNQTGTHKEAKPEETRLPNGSLSLSVSLAESFRGSAELIVFPGNTPAAPVSPNFGGFTFRLSSNQPK